MADAKEMKVTLVATQSAGPAPAQRCGLGLTRRQDRHVRGDAPTLGMIRKVAHLLRVEA
jgi:hypothetical protein